MSKVLEHIIGSQLSSFFESHSLFNKHQFGFRNGQSTMDALGAMVRDIQDAFENKDFAWATFIDLSKAFDCVDHGILLHKLEFYGVKNVELNFFRNYLSNRRQAVYCNGEWSSVAISNCGVPQGSVLGPLLFLVAINDLPFCINNTSYLYADDTTLMSRGSDLSFLEQEVKVNLSTAAVWFAANFFSMNGQKTQAVIFGLRPYPATLAPETCDVVKFLGVHVDHQLTWSYHIKHVCIRLSRLVFLFRRLRNLVPQDYLRSAYFAFFQSILSYGIIFWGNGAHINDVLLLQKKVLRIISNAHHLEHCRPIFINFKILTVVNLYIFNILLTSFKNLNSFTVRGDLHNHCTRNRSKLDVPYVRLEKTRDSHHIMGLRCLNKLPSNVLDLPLRAFKQKIQQWLVEHPFYNLNEFLSFPTKEIIIQA